MAKQLVTKTLDDCFEEDTQTLITLIEKMSKKYPQDSEQWKKLNSLWVSTETMIRMKL